MSAERPARPRSVGAIERRGSFWVIAAEPHVIVRLKRIFTRVDRAADGDLRIRSTPEVDLELQWLRERFVLDMEPKDEAMLHRGAELYRDQERVAAKVEAGTYIPREFAGMARPPRDYQRIAADLCLRNGSLLCGDDLGLGKTHVALTMFAEPRALPAVVVTVTATPIQWQEQIESTLPGLRTHVLSGTVPYSIPDRCRQLARRAGTDWPAGTQPDVLILPYSRMVGWMDVLKGCVTTLVFDEVQELRHRDTEKYRAAAAIRARATWCLGLSATPTHNYGGEFFNVLDLIRPGCLGTVDEFVREFCVSADDERKVRVKDPRAFGLYLRSSGLMLRRTRKDVGRELPPLTIIPTPIDADAGALEAVKHRVYELARTILNQNASTNLAKGQATRDMDRLLRQATGIAKAPYIAAFVRALVDTSGKPVLVFAWHREVYAILAKELGPDPVRGQADLKPRFYTGTESEKERKDAIVAFQTGQTKVLIMSLRSGAGIDGLQHYCDTVVIAELDWSPAVHNQAIGRINRDGQQNPVFAYYLLAQKGSDPTVADVCGAKTANTEPIRNPDQTHADVVQVDPDHIKRLATRWLAEHKP